MENKPTAPQTIEQPVKEVATQPAPQPARDDDLTRLMAGPDGFVSPALQIYLHEGLYQRCKNIANIMAAAEGATPPHLLGKRETCFSIIVNALTWKLNPDQVARTTYTTPGGSIGYEGKLVSAILMNSGRVEVAPQYDHYGPWDQVEGKWKMMKSQKGKDYPVPTWTLDGVRDKGIGVCVSVKMKGEVAPRILNLDLDRCYPLNSTLWATDPKTQICYRAIRRFVNLRCPEILLGVPFSTDDIVDVTPTQAATITSQAPRSDPFDRPKGDASAKDAPRYRVWCGECGKYYAKEPEACECGHEMFVTEKPPKKKKAPKAKKKAESEAEAPSADNEPEKLTPPEPSLGRGLRILADVKDVNDVADLRETILEELEAEAERVEWNAACDKRSKELTGE